MTPEERIRRIRTLEQFITYQVSEKAFFQKRMELAQAYIDDATAKIKALKDDKQD